MKHMIRLTTAASFILLSACSGINSVAPFDQEQAKILLKQSAVPTPARQGVVISPRPTATERQYLDTELVGYMMEPNASANLVANQTLKQANDDCISVNAKIIRDNRQSTVYQYTALQCKKDRPTFLIGKALNGDDGVYVVTFSGNHLDAATVKRGSTIIQSATLVDSTSRHMR